MKLCCPGDPRDCRIPEKECYLSLRYQTIVWFGYLQLIGPQSLGSIVVVSLCVLLFGF